MININERKHSILNIKEYDGKLLCQCFDCFDVPDNIDITTTDIKMKDRNDSSIQVILSNAQYLRYNGDTFAKIDDNGIIRICDRLT